MIVIAQFGTATETTAKLTLAAILILAVLGLVLCRRLATPWPGSAEVWVAGIVFFLFALPFLVSGKRPGPAISSSTTTPPGWRSRTRLRARPRGLATMPPVHPSAGAGGLSGWRLPDRRLRPDGGDVEVSGQDVAFTIQPSMAVAAVMMALLLFELARRLVHGVRRLGPHRGCRFSLRPLSRLLPLGRGEGAGDGGAAAARPRYLPAAQTRADWPRRAWAIAEHHRRGDHRRPRARGRALGGPAPDSGPCSRRAPLRDTRCRARSSPVAVLALVLVLPVLFTPTGPFDPLNGGVTGEAEIGNLLHPLSFLQAAGIWPSLDFRTAPHLEAVVKLLAVLCLLLAGGCCCSCPAARRATAPRSPAMSRGADRGALHHPLRLDLGRREGPRNALAGGAVRGAARHRPDRRADGFRRRGSDRPPRSSSASSSGARSCAYQGIWLAPRAPLHRARRRSTTRSPAKGPHWSPRCPATGRAISSATSTPRAPATAAAGRCSSSTESRRPSGVPVDLDEIRLRPARSLQPAGPPPRSGDQPAARRFRPRLQRRSL